MSLAHAEMNRGLAVADSDGRRERSGSDAIRVLVADDDPFARRMVCDRLASDGVHVVGQARNGEEAVALALELMPDVVIMDLLMPGCDGISATRAIVQRAPEAQVVILSVTKDQDAVVLALRAGAVGFLEKGIEMGALLRVVRGVHRGEAALDRVCTRALIHEFRALAAQAETSGLNGTQSAGSSLSHREQEVLELLAAEHGTESISVELKLAPATVRTHIKSVLRKLRVHSRQEAVSKARRRGLISRSIRPIGTRGTYGEAGLPAEPLKR
jgi:DNA-binding NarL/FixJ family response regulator